MWITTSIALCSHYTLYKGISKIRNNKLKLHINWAALIFVLHVILRRVCSTSLMLCSFSIRSFRLLTCYKMILDFTSGSLSAARKQVSHVLRNQRDNLSSGISHPSRVKYGATYADERFSQHRFHWQISVSCSLIHRLRGGDGCRVHPLKFTFNI